MRIIAVMLISGLAYAQAPAKGVSPAVTRAERRVAAQKEWFDDVPLCPAKLHRTVAISSLKNHCQAPYEPCLDECETGLGDSCYWLAVELEEHGASEMTQQVLYQRGCKLGIASACTNRAAYLVSPDKVDADVITCAIETFRLTCDDSDPWGCTMYAMFLASGEGIKRDDDLALKALAKSSCKFGEADPACRRAKQIRASIMARKAKKATKR